ncbi:ribonuclease III family protein [Thermodesulfovibrio sp.]|uniref:ribonuclease III family protein n=1 Tax=Thermodesulfovibrio sp. TaxID=2067987 RepID=UPI0030AEB440
MHPLFLENFQEIESILGYHFKNPHFLFQALTHSSYANENYLPSNERLEFLGDIILGFVVSEYLFNLTPELDEAEMSKIRAFLISRKFLAMLSRRLFIGRFIFLGKGEKLSGGFDKESILANTMEAIIGAIYLDGGITAVKNFLIPIVSEIFASEPFLLSEAQDFLQSHQNRQSL